MSLSPIINESDKHWVSMIDECRSSGLSDYEWCREHQISSTTFYNHAKKLRALACEPEQHDYSVPAAGQNVVQVSVTDEGDSKRSPVLPSTTISRKTDPARLNTVEPAMVITISGIRAEFSNSASASLIRRTINALQLSC